MIHSRKWRPAHSAERERRQVFPASTRPSVLEREIENFGVTLTASQWQAYGRFVQENPGGGNATPTTERKGN